MKCDVDSGLYFFNDKRRFYRRWTNALVEEYSTIRIRLDVWNPSNLRGLLWLLSEDEGAIGLTENDTTGVRVETTNVGDLVGDTLSVSFLGNTFMDANMVGAQEGSVLVLLKHWQWGRVWVLFGLGG